jgi:hypothetical protein
MCQTREIRRAIMHGLIQTRGIDGLVAGLAAASVKG